MTITINGETRECPAESTLSTLIQELGIKVKVMAAAINMEVVKKDDWESTKLTDGDKIELLHFVGGG